MYLSLLLYSEFVKIFERIHLQHFFFFFWPNYLLDILIPFFCFFKSIYFTYEGRLSFPLEEIPPLYFIYNSSYIFIAFLASSLNPFITLTDDLAEVSKNIMSPLSLQYLKASSYYTRLLDVIESSSAKSSLLPNTKKGSWLGLSG